MKYEDVPHYSGKVFMAGSAPLVMQDGGRTPMKFGARFGSKWADAVGSARVPCIEYRPFSGGCIYLDKEMANELVDELQRALADWVEADGMPLRSDDV